jgi:uncharacterized protein
MAQVRSYGIFILIALVVSGLLFIVLRGSTPPPKSATDFPADFVFEIADSQEERIRGLSGRADIPENYGMLFVFESPGRHGIWMKDMLVSIDIIWLSQDGTVLALIEHVSPATYPEVFYPPSPSHYVLETRAGEAARHGWGIGTSLKLPSL